MRGITKYLESGANCSERGWSWSIPSNNHYPCQAYYLYPNAPWYPAGAFSSGDIIANLDMICFILKTYDKESELVQKALTIADLYIGLLKNDVIDLTVMSDIEKSITIDHFLWFIAFIESSSYCNSFDSVLIYANLMRLASGKYSEKFSWYRNKDNMEDADKALDETVERLTMGGLWSENGLRCEDPRRNIMSLSERIQLFGP